jgi:hypothetical protein
MATSAPIGQWATPSGSLAIDEAGGATALVRTTLRTDAAVAASVQALAALSHPPFLGGSAVARGEDGYALSWPAATGTRRPLAALAEDWRRAPAAHVADAIGAALAVSRAVGELQHLAPCQYLLSPAQLFLETDEDGRQRWTALPLPIDTVQLKDMAAASPLLIAWLSGDDLVRRSGGDRAYMMAAVLHHALIGDLFPADLPPMRRLQRQIAYRAGNAVQLRAALEAAIPPNLALSARRLGDFMTESLGPGFGRPMTTAQAVAMLQRLKDELSAPLLAGGWETAGRPDLALAILESHARIAPVEDVPWQTLQRLRNGEAGGEQDGDRPADPPRPGPTDTPIGRIRALAAMGPEGLGALAATLNAILLPEAPALAEDERLFVAYAAARWLGASAVALPILAEPCVASWNGAVRALLLAWLHSDQQAWAQVARDCRECVTVIDALPGGGGERGAYASAYALMLDAGAHIGFVAAGHPADYLEDAWRKLERARALCAKVRAMPLDEALGTQLNALRRQLIAVPRLGKLLAEVEGARTQFSIVADNDALAAPHLPWPDERWLFA